MDVVLSGSFRRDPEGLRRIFEQLYDLGCRVLSPDNLEVEREHDGFVYMRGETSETPAAIERRHLDAIEAAQLVWLHAPDGYVGLSAALEVGFAHAAGIPVFATERPTDGTLAQFVNLVGSPNQAVAAAATHELGTPTALAAFQHYYRRIATQRGYEKEGAQQCLLLMVEEVGELARAIRKRDGLARHHDTTPSEGLELADVFLYVVHLANVLGLDLDAVVRDKERLNTARFLRKLGGHGQS